MIDEIQVENLALIRSASLAPARGLTVLTGETGAGKTALLSALKLLMGERADKSAVREGTDALAVSGRFFGLPARLAEADGSDDTGFALQRLCISTKAAFEAKQYMGIKKPGCKMKKCRRMNGIARYMKAKRK